MRKKLFQESQFGKIIPPNLLLPIAIAGILVISVSTYIEYRSRQEDYKQLLENQGTLFVKTLANTSQNALTAAGQLEEEISGWMVSTIQLVEYLDRTQPFSTGVIPFLPQVAKFDKIHWYNAKGELIKSTAPKEITSDRISQRIIQSALKRNFEHIIFELPDTNDAKNDRLVVMVPRKRGGMIAGIVAAERIRIFRRLFGFGHFLKRFQTGESVKYIVLENPQTIVAGIFDDYPISSFSEDPFLEATLRENDIKTRILNYPQQTIFEAVAPFNVDEESLGILRLGLSMDEYEALEKSAEQRMYIFAAVLTVLILIFLNFLQTYRHRQLLRKDLGHLQDYTNTVLENLGSGVITVDHKGRIQVVNKQALNLLSRDYDQLFGKSYSVFSDNIQRAIESCFNQKNSSSESSKIHYHDPDTSKQLSLKTTLLNQDQTSPTCILLIDDVTDQIRLEEQIRRNEKLAATRKLASAVAHEIRNPLNSISLLIDLVRKRFEPSKGIEEYRKNLQTMKNEISRISAIVEEFINFSRLPKTKLIPIHFPNLIREVIALFKGQLEKAKIEITIELEPHPSFHGDSEQLKQVFNNLVINAIEAIDPPGKIIIKGKATENGYEISIEDTGGGIKKEDLEHIFDLYFTTKKQGNGIGLAVVHQILLNHQGTIEVKNKEDQGAKFLIRFPYQ